MGVTEQEQLWGGETTKAVSNFPISGETVPVPVLRWLGRIKSASARVNCELGLLDQDRAERIAAAADRVAQGEFDDVGSQLRLVYENPASRLGDVHFFRPAPSEATVIFEIH